MKRITVIGGGNIGTLMSAEFARRGYEVTIYTRDTRRWSNRISVYDRSETLLFDATPTRITDSLEEAVLGADIIWITTPTLTYGEYASKLEPLVEPNQIVAVVPASGAEFAFTNLIEKGCTLLGLERVHSITRLKEYGRSVYELGKKETLYVAAIPNAMSESCAKLVEELFGIPTKSRANFLVSTLSVSNAFLHTSRCYSMFHEKAPTAAYDEAPLFYEAWDDESSKLIFGCDESLEALIEAIPLDLSEVQLLHEFYHSESVEELTETLRTLESFQGIASPMVERDGKYYANLDNRYFKADFPIDMKMIIELCHLFGVQTETLDLLWNWYRSVDDTSPCFELGITREELLSLYVR